MTDDGIGNPVRSYRTQATDAGFYITDEDRAFVVVRLANGDVHRVETDTETIAEIQDESLEDTLP